jgi:hypothetical protein
VGGSYEIIICIRSSYTLVGVWMQSSATASFPDDPTDTDAKEGQVDPRQRKRMVKMRRCGLPIPLILALAVFVWMPLAAHAQTANVQGVVDTLLARYKSAGQTWTGTIENASAKLFWILALISLSWTCISMGIKRAEPQPRRSRKGLHVRRNS